MTIGRKKRHRYDSNESFDDVLTRFSESARDSYSGLATDENSQNSFSFHRSSRGQRSRWNSSSGFEK